MAFKDTAVDDLTTTFFEMNEFASTHLINGDEVTCVVEGLTTNQHITKMAKKEVAFEGIANQTIVVHVRTTDLPEAIVAENIIDLDGIIYRVANETEDMGMTTFILEVDTL